MFTAAGGASDQEVHYFDDTDVLTIFRGGSLSWRTQNPGLLGLGMAALDNGSIGIAQGLPVFPSPDQGRRALRAWLGGQETAHQTLAGLYRRIDPDWTLPETSAPDGRRISRCPRTGLDGDVLLGRLNPGDIRAIADTIEARIGLIPGTILTRPLTSGEPESGHVGGNSPRTSGNRNIAINGRSAVHAGSEGILTTIDVCRTRIGKKCKPIPYMNVAESMDAVGTADSIRINGHPACHLDSRFSRSRGDEAGNCGGLRSGTRQGHAEFLTASGNVFFEGRPAVRQFDQMVSNCRNTPPAPLMQPGCTPPPEIDPEMLEAPPLAEPPYALRLDIDLDRAEGKGLLIELTTHGTTQQPVEAYPEPEPGHRGHHRMIFTGLEEAPVDLALRLEDPFYGIYRVPLASGVMPQKRNFAGDPELRVHRHRHQFVAVVLHRALDLDQRETAPIRPGCRVYIFRDGHLWRELEAGPEGCWFEVNLAQWQGQDERPAHCPLGAKLLLPHYVAGHLHEYHLAMSEIPWHWERIEGFGGMAWGDLRNQSSSISMNTNKPNRNDSIVAERFQPLCLGRDSARSGRLGYNAEHGGQPRKHFQLQDDRNDMLTLRDVSSCLIAIFQDPLQMTRDLKNQLDEQLTTLEKIEESATKGEIALGRLIQKMIEQNPELTKVADTIRIKRRLDKWDKITLKSNKIKNLTERKLAKIINSKDFDRSIEDFTSSENPETRGIGILHWGYAIFENESQESLDYLYKIALGEIVKIPVINGRDSEARKILFAWFESVEKLKTTNINLASIKESDRLKLITFSADAIEAILQALTEATLSKNLETPETGIQKTAELLERITKVKLDRIKIYSEEINRTNISGKTRNNTENTKIKHIELPKIISPIHYIQISQKITSNPNYRASLNCVKIPIITANIFSAAKNPKNATLEEQLDLVSALSALAIFSINELQIEKAIKNTNRRAFYEGLLRKTSRLLNRGVGLIESATGIIAIKNGIKHKNMGQVFGGSLIFISGAITFLIPAGPGLVILTALAIGALGQTATMANTRSKTQKEIINSYFGKTPKTENPKDIKKEIEKIIISTVKIELKTIIHDIKSNRIKSYKRKANKTQEDLLKIHRKINELGPEDPVIIEIIISTPPNLIGSKNINGSIEFNHQKINRKITEETKSKTKKSEKNQKTHFYLEAKRKEITHGIRTKIEIKLPGIEDDIIKKFEQKWPNSTIFIKSHHEKIEANK
ncbi:PAAR-like domain-containing protein [Ectothiorhodospira lacustris]|uniref:PAAR-like domain-containing protein n=1 Tax=Ectothiorhodospira lacustris TaxID=2899127 RepID=UPI001EE79292|nr:PAAR-like domain-containing protein [Ectothiorhodospira lacustris]MCG5509580.1 DUF4150 domain-containing protein [Ectothiorhodospira lacustris]MCG5521625.1 DUF4150 domain-containing protein [Ectothiorhodospira lacustris]